jgi:hypothetical protein
LLTFDVTAYVLRVLKWSRPLSNCCSVIIHITMQYLVHKTFLAIVNVNYFYLGVHRTSAILNRDWIKFGNELRKYIFHTYALSLILLDYATSLIALWVLHCFITAPHDVIQCCDVIQLLFTYQISWFKTAFILHLDLTFM